MTVKDDFWGEPNYGEEALGKADKKREVVNMNYPPDDMPIEEQERFWGELSDEAVARIEAARNAAVEALRKGKSHAKPSPV